MSASWDIDISKWVAKAKENGVAVAIETTQDIFEEVVRTTPKITGNLQRSWYTAINGMPVGKFNGNASPIAQAMLVAYGMKVGDTIHHANFAKYARRVELGFVGRDSLGRAYNQTGRHTVNAALAKAQIFAEAAANRVIKR